MQALSAVTDYNYYGKWTSSVLNLLIYNVAGGGESHLYGTEGPLFYLKNGFNNFNFCFVLAMLFLGFWPIVKKKYGRDLLIVISPLYIWLAFMSLQPHKEERFGNFCTWSSFTNLNILCYLRNSFNTLAHRTHNVYYFTECYVIKWISISCFHYFWFIQVCVLLFAICNIASSVAKDLGTLSIGWLDFSNDALHFKLQ